MTGGLRPTSTDWRIFSLAQRLTFRGKEKALKFILKLLDEQAREDEREHQDQSQLRDQRGD